MDIVGLSQKLVSGLQYLLLAEPAFFILGMVIVLSAIYTVTTHNLVHSAMGLLACFAGVAGLYFYLEAYFVGISQILIYAVGIVLIILFAVMILSEVRESEQPVDSSMRIGFLHSLTLGFTSVLFMIFSWAILASQPQLAYIVAGVTEHRANTGIFSRQLWQLGEKFMSEQILAFELISILLLVALVGAILIARPTTATTSPDPAK